MADPDSHEEVIQSYEVQARHENAFARKRWMEGVMSGGRKQKQGVEWVPLVKHALRKVMETETALSLGEARQCMENPGDLLPTAAGSATHRILLQR